ncbi:hypothetical protein, partial [Ruminococcus champanellensis]|uniref:hypothetical protein n=1 Tax=Ruminococcus champanellensis TaxID=1161942 RepID=UPI002E797A30
GFYNPTLFKREFSSGWGLQTSHHPVDEGSERLPGGYPPASCGFYTRHDGKAVFKRNQVSCICG